MQGKRFSLRLGLMALVVVLIFGALGSLSLARDAFDDDYDDCPARTRLDAVSGLTIDRTDEDDEIRVSWDALEDAVLASLGPNGYRARLTVIVEDEDDGTTEEANVALGDTSKLFEEIEFTDELTVSVAVTLGDYVISDIAEVDFVSGMPAPSFKTFVMNSSLGDLRNNRAFLDGSGNVNGHFYYLGFNDYFDNWYSEDATLTLRPASPKFRVGLAHGGASVASNGNVTPSPVDPDEADFENYRITIEDSNGDLLGYQAETVAGGNTYGINKIIFGTGATTTSAYFTNMRLSDQVRDRAVAPYYESGVSSQYGLNGLAHGHVGFVTENTADPLDIFTELTAAGFYAEPPVEYFDFPKDVFEDDGNYVIKAWAEDDDGTRISPQASITLSVQERGPVRSSTYQGYDANGQRDWDASVPQKPVTQYSFSIQEED